MRRLLTIPISHFCEKARWALERAGLVFRAHPAGAFALRMFTAERRATAA